MYEATAAKKMHRICVNTLSRGLSGRKSVPICTNFELWKDFEGVDWIPAHNCSCPDSINEFRALRRRELLAALVAGRDDEAERLLSLEGAAGFVIDIVYFPKHARWKQRHRNAKGRFASLGTEDSILEITREPTVARHLRANTARPPSRQHQIGSHHGGDALNENAVVWVLTRPREAGSIQEPDLKREGEKVVNDTSRLDNMELERV